MNHPTRTTAASARRAATLLALACALLCAHSATAVAQDKQGAPADDQFQGPLKEQLREYWSVERDLSMVIDRLYSRKGKILLGAQLGVMPSEPFFTYYPVGIHGGYFLSETFGVEGSASFHIPTKSDLTAYLEEERGDNFNLSQDAGDKYIARISAVATWHPLYGKWALLQRKVSHLDFNLLGGLGVVIAERPNSERTSSSSTVIPEVVLGAGMSFFLTKATILRLQWRSYLTPGPTINTSDALEAQGFFGRLNVPSEFILGASYAF